MKTLFYFHRFDSRSGGNSNTITGADYEDVRQDTRRRHGDNTRGHRYHREANGTLNFYDFEDVEKDRKKFLGKGRRHEAEEVDNGERLDSLFTKILWDTRRLASLI